MKAYVYMLYSSIMTCCDCGLYVSSCLCVFVRLVSQSQSSSSVEFAIRKINHCVNLYTRIVYSSAVNVALISLSLLCMH